MKKKICLTLLVLFCLNLGFSSTSSCISNVASSTWHCSNNSPGISLSPGETTNYTILCCYTSPGLTGEEEYSLSIDKLSTYSRNVQQPDGSWVMEQTDYVATEFIKSIDYPETVNPNIDIPVVITFSLPEEHELYEPNAVLKSRTDFKLTTDSAFILNNAIEARVIIPGEWSPSLFVVLKSFIANNYLLLGAILLLLIVIAVFFYFKKK